MHYAITLKGRHTGGITDLVFQSKKIKAKTMMSDNFEVEKENEI